MARIMDDEEEIFVDNREINDEALREIFGNDDDFDDEDENPRYNLEGK